MQEEEKREGKLREKGKENRVELKGRKGRRKGRKKEEEECWDAMMKRKRMDGGDPGWGEK